MQYSQSGRFERIKVLGQGAFGRVYLVSDNWDGQRYALKCFEKERVVKNNEQQLVLDEEAIHSSLTSNFVVNLVAAFDDLSHVCFLMEVCVAGDLAALIVKRGGFNEREASFYMRCIMEGLDYIHAKNIVHRDLKPENVFIDGKGYAKIGDFGLAKKITPGEKEYGWCGTVPYMAPEMVEYRGYDSSFDLWSLGAIIYQMLSGKLAFDGKDSTEIENKIKKGISITIHMDDEFKGIINSLCHMNPAHRLVAYQTQVRSTYYYTLWNDISTLNVQPPFSIKPYFVL